MAQEHQQQDSRTATARSGGSMPLDVYLDLREWLGLKSKTVSTEREFMKSTGGRFSEFLISYDHALYAFREAKLRMMLHDSGIDVSYPPDNSTDELKNESQNSKKRPSVLLIDRDSALDAFKENVRRARELINRSPSFKP